MCSERISVRNFYHWISSNAFIFDIVSSQLCCYIIIIIVWVFGYRWIAGKTTVERVIVVTHIFGCLCAYIVIYARAHESSLSSQPVVAGTIFAVAVRAYARDTNVSHERNVGKYSSIRNSFWVRFAGDDYNRTFIMLFVSVCAIGIFWESKRVDQ